MRSPSLAPSHGAVHLILCDFGKLGLAYVETEPVSRDKDVVEKILSGEYTLPVEVIAFDAEEGWARNVSEHIAGLIIETARREERTISKGGQKFVEKHLDEEVEPELCA